MPRSRSNTVRGKTQGVRGTVKRVNVRDATMKDLMPIRKSVKLVQEHLEGEVDRVLEIVGDKESRLRDYSVNRMDKIQTELGMLQDVIAELTRRITVLEYPVGNAIGIESKTDGTE